MNSADADIAKDRLLGMNVDEFETLASDAGAPRYAARQLCEWLYGKKVGSIDAMTSLSKAFRKSLSDKFDIGLKPNVDCQVSSDGTKKYLFPASCGGLVETVFIPSGDRGTVCVSSQVGCKMHCSFCLTGRQGFGGQLDAGDILNQLFSLPEREKVTNIVFMGQGEPLDNYDNVLKAIDILTSEKMCAMSPGRITLSTCGILPALKRLVDDAKCNIAVSLHSPFHEERMKIMPVEKAFPAKDIVDFLKTCEEFKALKHGESRSTSHQRRLSFEYVLLRCVNDTDAHVKALAALLDGLDCRVNVIPYHSYAGGLYKSPSYDEVEDFCLKLNKRHVRATMRRSRGKDISAACGMLAARRKTE